MSTLLRPVLNCIPNSRHAATPVISTGSSGKRHSPVAVQRTRSDDYDAEFPPLFDQVTVDQKQSSAYESDYEFEFEAGRQADLRIIERWGRNYANVTTPRYVDPTVLIYKRTTLVPVVDVEKVNEVEPKVAAKFDLANHVSRWLTVVPSRTKRAEMKKSVVEPVVKGLSETTAVELAPTARNHGNGYAEKVKKRAPRKKVQTMVQCRKPAEKAKVRKTLPKKKAVPQPKFGYAPMHCTLKSVDSERWIDIPCARRKHTSQHVLIDEPEVPVVNKFVGLKEVGIEALTPRVKQCSIEAKRPCSVLKNPKPRARPSRKQRLRSRKIARMSVVTEDPVIEPVEAKVMVSKPDPSVMFLFLLKYLISFFGLNARVLPVSDSSDIGHSCCSPDSADNYDVLYVPFAGEVEVESLAICDRRRENETSQRSVILCMTKCEEHDAVVASTIARLQGVLEQHGWHDCFVDVRCFASCDPDMCLLDVARSYEREGYSEPVQFCTSTLNKCLREGRNKPESRSLENLKCMITWQKQCDDIPSCDQNRLDVSLVGGSSMEANSCTDSFLHKVLSICSEKESMIRVLNQRAFATISEQKCCALREDNDYSLLVIPVLDDESKPRALLVCDRRCTPANVINLLPVVPGGIPRWGKADDKTVKKLLEMHGYQKYKYKVIRKKDCEDPALYLLTALSTILNGSYQEIDFATLAAEPSLAIVAASVATEHLRCALSANGCTCKKAGVVVVETAPVRAVTETPKSTPLKRKSNVTQLSPSTVSPSPGKTRRVFQDKLTKGIVRNAKVRREKSLVVGSLATLNDGQWVEGEVLNAFMSLVQQLTDSHFRILDPNLNEFDPATIHVSGYPLKGKALYPVNLGRVHWCLGLFDFDTIQVILFDSDMAVTSPSLDCLTRIQKVWTLCSDSKLLHKHITIKADVCKQSDSFNCGLFTCYHALCLMSERSIDTNFTSSVADKFREIVAEFLRRNVLVRDEDGKIFESGVYMFPSDSLVMAKQMPELDLKMQDQPLPVPVFPKTVSAKRRTTPRATPVRSCTPNNSRRRNTSDIVVVSDDIVVKTPSKSVPNTKEKNNIVQVCSTPTTIDKVSAKLNSSCILDDGNSPIQQRRITRSSSRTASTRQPVVETSVVETVQTPNPPDLVAPTVVPKTVSGKRRTTPRVTPVRSTTPRSRVSLGRRKASDVGVVSERTPAKSVAETNEITNVVPVCSTPNTIDRVSAQLDKACNLKDGMSPLKQPRLTRSSSRKASTRQLFSDQHVVQDVQPEATVVETVETIELSKSVAPTPNTIDKMTTQMEQTNLSREPSAQPGLTKSSSGKSTCSRQLFSKQDGVPDTVSDVVDSTYQAVVVPDPVVVDTAAVRATGRGKELFSQKNIDQIMLLMSSHANAKTVVLSPYALMMGGVPRRCCSLERNEFSICVLLIKERRKATGLLICDRRSPANVVITLYAPDLENYTYIDESFAHNIVKQHGWSDYQANMFRRKNVLDVKTYFANIMLSVLVEGVYDEGITSIRKVAVFLQQHLTRGKNLMNDSCGVSDTTCRCPSRPSLNNHALSQAYSFVPPPFVALTCVDRAASQNTQVPVTWTKKTHIFTSEGDKRELMLESLKSLRRNGPSLERYLVDYVVHAFCSLVSLSQMGTNCIIDPLVLSYAQTIPGYKDREFPVQGGAKLFPMCHNSHWVLAVLDFDSDSVIIFDSQQHQTNSLVVKSWISKIVHDVWELYTDAELDEVTSAPLNLIAKQTSDYNCGVFVCYHALRQIMRLNDDPNNFTEQSADEFRDEISLWLRENFHVRDELVANENTSHIALFAQAPVMPQDLDVCVQDLPPIEYHTSDTAEQGSDTAPKKNTAKKIYTGNQYDRQPHMNDDYMYDRNSDIMCSSEDDDVDNDVVARSVHKSAAQNAPCSPVEKYLRSVCATSAKKVVILSSSLITHPNLIHKCCSYDKNSKNYEVIVLPVVINKELCAVIVGTKPEPATKRTFKPKQEKVVILTNTDNNRFTGSATDRNLVRIILTKHGWTNQSITSKATSGVLHLLAATKRVLSNEQVPKKLSEKEAEEELERLPKYSESTPGMLQNGQCNDIIGVCGCPLSGSQALICSYLKQLQDQIRDKTNIAILSPRLIEAADGTRYNCVVWNKMLNDYDVAFMPIEIEGMYGLVRVDKKPDKNRNRNASVYVGLSKLKKEKEPCITTQLRKKIKSIFALHGLPIATMKVEAEHTENVIAHLAYMALSSVQEKVDKVDFMNKWLATVDLCKDLRSCAHLVKCPCKLYGDSRGRKGCAIYKNTDLLPNGWSLGPMSKRCQYCDAHLFKSESSAICCQNGKVKVTAEELSQKTPETMRKFKEIAINDSGIFSRTMQINNHLSPGHNIYRQREIKTPGERTLVIHGTYTAGVCHVEGRNASDPAFAQIYLTAADTLNACMSKYAWQTKKIKEYMLRVVVALKQNNVLLQNYMTSGELLKAERERRKAAGIAEEPSLLMIIKDRREDMPDGVLPDNVHKGRINKPAVNNQVACIYVGDHPSHEDLVNGIRVKNRGGQTVAPHFLSNLDGLLFVILFPNGEVGYIHDANKYKRPEGRFDKTRKSNADPDSDDDHNLDGSDDMVVQNKETNADAVSRREFTLFMLARRGSADDLKLHRILGWGKLTAQWILFSWTRIEADRVASITKNMTEIRGIHQSALFTRLDAELQRKKIPLGALTYMPSSYIGGPKWLQKNFKNAMCVAQKEGNPHIFATMTGNAEWDEIKANRIHTKDGWITDPMLVARVFHEKLQELLNDIRSGKVFGEIVALQYSIEFQKRGMPHAHILITLKNWSNDPAFVDKIVCAELPILPDDINDPTYDSIVQLRDKVIKHMIHRPCKGKTRMSCRQGYENKEKCQKKFPFDHSEMTHVSKQGHHIYRRRKNIPPFVVGKKQNKVFATNADVVPYNKWLLSKYDCHLNVEIVCSATACKYIFKYIYKGPDRLVLELLGDDDEAAKARKEHTIRDENNEAVIAINMAQEHVNARYVSQVEAAYRLLGYAMQGTLHTVVKLMSHEPDGKFVYFHAKNQNLPMEAKKSELEAYFDLIEKERSTDGADKDLTWTEVAEQYRFDKAKRVYIKRLIKKRLLAYINFVPPKFPESYAVRLLLSKRAASSFDDLRTIGGVLHPTFVEAAVAAGYMHADEEWDRCLALVSHHAMPREIRRVFASLLVYCKVLNARELWEKYKEHMRNRRNGWTVDRLDQYSLSHIDWILRMQGSSLQKHNMDDLLDVQTADPAVQYDPDTDIDVSNVPAANPVPQLNVKQTEVLNTVLTAVQQPVGAQKRLYFLYGKAGCGKTFTYNQIIRECRAMGKRVIAVASTGIAATLLEGGRTAHSTFQIPIELEKDSIIRMDARSQTADRLRKADLIVWDEAPMQSRYAMEAVDRMMRDISEPHRRRLPFGGTTVVFGGDWSQFLPVVRSNRGCDLETETIKVTLKSSDLWREMTVLTLDQNMRVAAGQEDHMQWLRKVGEGRCQYMNTSCINLPLEMYAETEKEIIDWMYTPEVLSSPARLGRVALLSVKNDDTLDLNEQILKRLPGREFVLSSADECANLDTGYFGLQETVEYLNTQTPPGFPPHKLTLRIGCIVMLLRNIDVAHNLCNGTRLEVLDVLQQGQTHLLKCRHLNAVNNAECYIQRMPLTYKENADLSGLAFKRVQFPIRLSFAMTTNKSQGQTFDKVGLILRTPAFAHGSTYVALSRCTSKEGIKVTMNRKPLDDAGKPYIPVRNVVYRRMIDDE